MHEVTVSNDETTTSVGSASAGSVWLARGIATWALVGLHLEQAGGISFLSGLYGWACDNVKNYQIVLADGNIVDANLTTNPDLYRALRGGGNQFGIVTRFDLHTVPLGDMWGGVTIVPIALNKTVYEYYHDFNQCAAQDPNAHLIVALSCAPGLIPNQPCFFTNFYVYAKPVVNPPIFYNFTALPNITSTARIANISNLTAELAEQQPYGSRELWVDVTFKNDAGILEQAASMFADAVLPIYAMNLTGFAAASATQPVTSTIIANMQKNGGNALGIEPDDGPLTVLNINYKWSDEKDDAFLESSAYAPLNNLTVAAKARGVYFRYEYMNYAGKLQDPYGGYGADSKAELLATSQRYDPDRVFASLQPGYFVLS
ncbi:hypothetical protein LTR86_009727 [Recurvomyces mirabilis]|nr:hypothetical protein LTR86_009727 [Recurvomyces mirabilis]